MPGESNTQKTLVSVCLCTFRRPHVIKTLESLAVQDLPAHIALEIIVVDNDARASGRDAVAAFAAHSPHPVRYDVEPVQNISRARNRCLDLARGAWIAILDDDEIAAPDWIANHLDTARRLGADILIGKINARFDAAPPPWIGQSRLFVRALGGIGQPVKCASTGNAFVRAAPIRVRGLRFDPDYGLAGEEDNDFFDRLGLPVLCNPSAQVWETQTPDRLELAYHKARARAFGATQAHRTLARHGERAVFKLLAKNFGVMIAACCLAALLFPLNLGRSRYYQVLTVKCRARLLYVFRRRRFSYYDRRA